LGDFTSMADDVKWIRNKRVTRIWIGFVCLRIRTSWGWTFVNTVMNLVVLYKARDFLTSRTTVRVSTRRAVFRVTR
jgi:hypothetical protein